MPYQSKRRLECTIETQRDQLEWLRARAVSCRFPHMPEPQQNTWEITEIDPRILLGFQLFVAFALGMCAQVLNSGHDVLG